MHSVVACLGSLVAIAAAGDVLIPPNMGGTEQFGIIGTGVLANDESKIPVNGMCS